MKAEAARVDRSISNLTILAWNTAMKHKVHRAGWDEEGRRVAVCGSLSRKLVTHLFSGPRSDDDYAFRCPDCEGVDV